MQILTRELLRREPPRATFAPGFELSRYLKYKGEKDGHPVLEFVGLGDFNSAWFTRQRYEIDAGRESEPLLYEPLYATTEDASLPKNVTVYQLNAGGIVFEEVLEGGEVKFATLGDSNKTIGLRRYAVGLEYTRDMMEDNELWNLSIVERRAGIALNALYNHVHLSPFINATLTGNNATSANAGGTGSTIVEKTLRTIEDAVVASTNDSTNPRRGPYYILCNTANRYTIERALGVVPQQGFNLQSSVINEIAGVIAYNGWIGKRGKVTTTYSGVQSNTAYLINVGFRDQDHLSFIKTRLENIEGNEDVSRLIEMQQVWYTRFGVYCNPVASTQKITLPTS